MIFWGERLIAVMGAFYKVGLEISKKRCEVSEV